MQPIYSPRFRVAYGRGGALHAGALMQEVGLSSAIVPRYPGVTSAMGCVIADMRADFVQAVNALIAGADTAALAGLIQEHHDAGQAQLDAAGVAFEAREPVFSLDMAYVGQTHTVSVPLPVTLEAGRVRPASVQDIAAAFDAAYLATYGRLLPGGVTRILNLRDALRARGGCHISAQFTLVPGRGGEPIIAAHLRQLRPFLAKGDFAPGPWGNRVVDALQTPDVVVEKVIFRSSTRAGWTGSSRHWGSRL